MTSGAGQGATAAPTGAGVQRRPGTGTGPAGWLSRSGRRGRGLRSGPGRPGRKRRSPPTLAGTLAALEAELGRAPAALLSVTGECLPLPEIASLAHRHGAQLVPHRRVSPATLSGHEWVLGVRRGG